MDVAVRAYDGRQSTRACIWCYPPLVSVIKVALTIKALVRHNICLIVTNARLFGANVVPSYAARMHSIIETFIEFLAVCASDDNDALL